MGFTNSPHHYNWLLPCCDCWSAAQYWCGTTSSTWRWALTAATLCVICFGVKGTSEPTIVTEEHAARRQLVAALARVGKGDRAALRLVYENRSAKLFGVCLRILGVKAEAEDVLQGVYLTVWRRAATFDPGRASPISWLVAIARNRSIDRLRANATTRRMQPIDDALDISDPTPGAREQVETSQQRLRLSNCLDELEERHATAIRAAFLDGATYEMLAERIGVPPVHGVRTD
jgi:RNA polymerase sigma factor (sigma-70 family)